MASSQRNNAIKGQYGNLFPYDASIAGCVVFIVLFAGLFAFKIYDYIRFKKTVSKEFKFMQEFDRRDEYIEDVEFVKMMKKSSKNISVSLIPITLGIFFEFLGYALRIVAIKDTTYSKALYIVPQTFILLAPSLISAGIFMIFNRIEKFLKAEKYSLIPTRMLTFFFVTGDIVSFLVQGGGGSLMIDRKSRNLGFKLLLIGFALQLFFFGMFVVVGVRFLILISKNPTKISKSLDSNELDVKYFKWKKFAILTISSMQLIVIRCILRLAEFCEGSNGKLGQSEVAYYMMDPLLIFGCCAILVYIKPEYRLWDLKTYAVWHDISNDDNEVEEGISLNSTNSGVNIEDSDQLNTVKRE